jgi:uncharacterized protein involved in outer membrane biogenesis
MGKRILLALIAVVVLAAAGAAWLVMTKGNEYVASAIERYGSAATGTSVRVGSVELALTQGRGDVKGLTIGNPQGYSSSYFLKVDDITLSIDLGSLGSRVPVVKEAVVDAAHLNAEQHGQTTNLTDIERQISGPAPSKTTPAAAAKDEGRIIIDRFRLTHGRITLTSDLLKHPEELELADVSIDGIGRASGGVTYEQAAEAVLDPILRATRNAVETRLRKAAEDAARDKAESALRDRLQKSLERN